MNDFSNEMNEIYKLAGVRLNEEQGYFTDWNSIKERVIERYIDARLEETGMLYNDEYYIQEWLEQNASADMLEELYEESGETEINWVANYINKNADENGIVSKVANNMISEYFNDIAKQIQKEFEQNNLIYRMIDSDKSPKEIAQLLKTNGTGNCWAKQEENAKAYYGNGNYNEYCLIGEATMDNVNWETTIFLRMMAEEENEVRLRKDAPIHIVSIKFYHYNEDNKLDKQDHMKVDLNLNVGHSYVFNESKQINEELLSATENDLSDAILKNPTKNELKEYRNVSQWRILQDTKGNYYFGDAMIYVHSTLEKALLANNIDAVSADMDNYGITFYSLPANTFYYRLLNLISQEDIEREFKNSYLPEAFPNSRLERSNDDDEELDESVKILNKEESDDTKLVTSPYELNQILINNNEMRVIYDKNKKWYIIGNPETNIHFDMLRDAMIDGLYTMNDGFGRMMNGTKYEDGQNYYREHKDDFIIFRTTSDINNDEEYIWDDYRYSYEYKDYCVFDRNNDFPQTTLYKILGKPIAVNYFGNDEDELDESIAYVSKKDLSDIILKNPTRKELKENGLEFCRYMFEDDNTYYFVDAKEYSHLDISQLFLDIFKNYNLHTDGGYYSVKENCFYIRNDFGCEKNKERLDNTKLLHKLFGNFKSIIYEGDYPEEWDGEDDEEELDESIAYVSKKDLSDIILKNPTKKELKDNNLVKCRCMEDAEGNWYFADMENMLHYYMVTALRNETYFPLFDGNDCYGIAYYDAESNEFWYNLNDYMYRKECVEQYKNSEYLRTTFPNARIIPNPWGNQSYDDEEHLYEEVAYKGRLIDDTILKNPTRKELREWDLMNCRVVLDWKTNDFYFGDAYNNIHDDIISKVNSGENDSLYYDCYNNTFYKRDEYRNENEKMYMERSLSQWLSSFEYIKNTFGGFNTKICMEEEPFD